MKIKWHNENKLHMQVKENNGVTYLTYPSFEQFPDIVHCFSTRLGGVSQGIFSSMNLSFTRGDEENAVKDKQVFCLSSILDGTVFEDVAILLRLRRNCEIASLSTLCG